MNVQCVCILDEGIGVVPCICNARSNHLLHTLKSGLTIAPQYTVNFTFIHFGKNVNLVKIPLNCNAREKERTSAYSHILFCCSWATGCTFQKKIRLNSYFRIELSTFYTKRCTLIPKSKNVKFAQLWVCSATRFLACVPCLFGTNT